MPRLALHPIYKNFREMLRKLKVEVVTSLVIRRQFYRQVDAWWLGRLLEFNFVILESLRHESWQGADAKEQERFELGTSNIFYFWTGKTALVLN
jgi:hypothetical protein